MLFRNSLLLAILAWPALLSSVVPMVLMILASLLFAWRTLNQSLPDPEAPKLNLEQPFSLSAALRFGLIFLALHVAGTLAQRYLGMFGFYPVSIAGSMLSSASAVAAAGTAAAHNEVPVQIAANGAVLASVAYEYTDRYSTGGKSRVSADADDSTELCSLCHRCSWDRRHCHS
jgi:uncharacterized membrane protein (DUF4010 family)